MKRLFRIVDATEQIVGRERYLRTSHRHRVNNEVVRRRVNSTVMRLMMSMKTLLITILLLGAGCCSASAQKCLEYGPMVSLTGTLPSKAFPGPPNYESIRRGDRKETAIILALGARACTTGNDSQGFDVPENDIREMQLVIMKEAHWKTVRRLMGKRATITGTLFHGHTGHHRTKVLVDVANIRTAA